MAKNNAQDGHIESRLIGLFASLFFSVPTAALLWFGINKELAYWGGFLSSNYLVVFIIVFAVMALLFPQLFPSILGVIWRCILKVGGWW